MARPRSFDPAVVVDDAMQRFWSAGYAATSPRDLVDATGLNRSSLYNAFGSKQGLFLQVLDRYAREETGRLLAVLDADGTPTDRLHDALLLVVRAAAEDAEGRGCLVTNTAVEGADPEIRTRVAAILEAQRTAFAGVLREAAAAGETRPGVDPVAAATALLAAINGLRATARAGVAPGDPEAVVSALLGGIVGEGAR